VVGQTTLNTHKGSTDHDGRYFTETEQDARFAPIAKGVTNGDAHDHAGGDGEQIPLAGHADNSVDDTKAGNRVPQFYRRQGGSPTNWDSYGTTSYTPTAVRMQAGAARTAEGGVVTVTFPVAFSANPLVFLTATEEQAGVPTKAYVASVSTTQLVINGAALVVFNWLAIGPE